MLKTEMWVDTPPVAAELSVAVAAQAKRLQLPQSRRMLRTAKPSLLRREIWQGHLALRIFS